MLIGAAANGTFAQPASTLADSMSQDYSRVAVAALWMLSDYELRRGDVAGLGKLATLARRKADSTRAASDQRMARSIEARLLVAQGDTTRAIEFLRSLSPTVTRPDFAWVPWASLSSERMLLARLLLGRADYEGARRMASFVDSAEPIANPFYIRESLDLRARAAEAMGNARLAQVYRARLRKLVE